MTVSVYKALEHMEFTIHLRQNSFKQIFHF